MTILSVLIILAVLVAGWIYLTRKWDAERLAELTLRFGEPEARRIMREEVWVGMSAGALTESRGEPVATDRSESRGRLREVWKYDRIGSGRYGTRITLDNGEVTSFDIKERT